MEKYEAVEGPQLTNYFIFINLEFEHISTNFFNILSSEIIFVISSEQRINVILFSEHKNNMFPPFKLGNIYSEFPSGDKKTSLNG